MSAALESLKDILPESWAATKKRASNDVSTTNSNEADYSGHEDEEDVDDEEENTFELPSRVIRPAHFDMAFEQVAATCSEDMASVQELRRWATKFSAKSSAPLYMRPPNSATTAPTYGQIRPGPRASVDFMGSASMMSSSPYRGMLNADGFPSAIHASQKGGSNT